MDRRNRLSKECKGTELGAIVGLVEQKGYLALNDTQGKVLNAAVEAREEFLADRKR